MDLQFIQHRVLKSGGTLVLVAQDDKELANDRVASTGIFHIYSHEEITKLLAEAGFKLAGMDQRKFNYRAVAVIGEKLP